MTRVPDHSGGTATVFHRVPKLKPGAMLLGRILSVKVGARDRPALAPPQPNSASSKTDTDIARRPLDGLGVRQTGCSSTIASTLDPAKEPTPMAVAPNRKLRFETLRVHAGQDPAPGTNARAVPTRSTRPASASA